MFKRYTPGAVATICYLAYATSVHAEPLIFVANWQGPLAEYNLDGTTANASLARLGEPAGIAVSGSSIYVTNLGTGKVDEYSTAGGIVTPSLISPRGPMQGFLAVAGPAILIPTGYPGGGVEEYSTSGTLLNASLVSGLAYPSGIAVSGGHIFVTNVGSDTLGEYNLDGTPVNASLIRTLHDSQGVAVSDSDIFVTNYQLGTVSEYALDGTLVNASLISGLMEPRSIELYGSDIFIMNTLTGTIGEYTTSGTTVDAALITGLTPGGITSFTIADASGASAVPEPASAALLATALGLTTLARRRRSQRD